MRLVKGRKMTSNKYCPICRSEVTKYLGQDSQPETNTFYMCHNCDRSYSFEQLVDTNFKEEVKERGLIKLLRRKDGR